MTLVLVSCLVLGPLAILLVNLVRGVAGRDRVSAPAEPLQLDADGHRLRAPRPKWPVPSATVSAAAPTSAAPRGFRPTGGRKDFFGDGVLDRSS